MRRRNAFLFAGLAGLVLIGAAGMGSLLPSRSAGIAIDPSTAFQTMTGWEVTSNLADTPVAPPWASYQDVLLDRAVEEVGINRVRLTVRSSAESRNHAAQRFLAGEMDYDAYKEVYYDVENDNDDPFAIDPAGFDFEELDWHVRTWILPLRERLAARGERLVVNLCYVAFGEGPTLHMQPEEYAEFVLATYRHLDETWGFVPDLWEVMLEPDLHGAWDGRMIGEAMAAAGRRLEEAGYAPAFVAPSVASMANAVPYAEAIADIPGAAEHWEELSYHRYRDGSRKNLAAIAAFAEEAGLRTSMLEWWFGHATHDVLRQDLQTGQVSAWQGRAIAGLYEAEQTGDGLRLIPQPDTRTNRLYFLAARLGAVRVGATSTAPDTFVPTAFVNPDGRMALVVEAARGGEITVTGLAPGRYEVTMALQGTTPEPRTVEVTADALVLSIPDQGLVSVVARAAP